MAAPIQHNPKVLDFFTSTVHKDSDFRSFSPKRSESSSRHKAASIFSKTRVPNSLSFLVSESQKIVSSGEINKLSPEKLRTFSTNLELLSEEISKIEGLTEILGSDLTSTRKALQQQQIKERGTTVYKEIVAKAKIEAEEFGEPLSFEGIWAPSEPDQAMILGVLELLEEENLTPQEINSFAEQFGGQDLSALIACLLPFVTDKNLVQSIFGKHADLDKIQIKAMTILTTLVTKRKQRDSNQWPFIRSGITDLMQNVFRKKQ